MLNYTDSFSVIVANEQLPTLLRCFLIAECTLCKYHCKEDHFLCFKVKQAPSVKIEKVCKSVTYPALSKCELDGTGRYTESPCPPRRRPCPCTGAAVGASWRGVGWRQAGGHGVEAAGGAERRGPRGGTLAAEVKPGPGAPRSLLWSEREQAQDAAGEAILEDDTNLTQTLYTLNFSFWIYVKIVVSQN